MLCRDQHDSVGPGSKIKLGFSMDDPTLSAEGVVARLDPGSGIAVQFREMNREGRERMFRILEFVQKTTISTTSAISIASLRARSRWAVAGSGLRPGGNLQRSGAYNLRSHLVNGQDLVGKAGLRNKTRHAPNYARSFVLHVDSRSLTAKNLTSF